MKDWDGVKVNEGDTISFSYGIPPVRVIAPVVMKEGVLTAIATGHNPPECDLKSLKKYVGGFYRVEPPQAQEE